MTVNEDRFTISAYMDPLPYETYTTSPTIPSSSPTAPSSSTLTSTPSPSTLTSTPSQLRLHTPRPALTSAHLSSSNRPLLPSPVTSPSVHTPLSSIFSSVPIQATHDVQVAASLPRSFSSSRTYNMESGLSPPRMDRVDSGFVKGDRHEHEMDTMDKEKDIFATGIAEGVSSSSGMTRTKWGRIFPSSAASRLLLATVVIESLTDLAIEGNILWRFNSEVRSTSSTVLELENKRRLPVYLVIFGLAHLWQLVLTVIAIRQKNTVQVIAVTAFNFAFLGYAVVEIDELRSILGSNLAESLDGQTDSDLMSLPLNVLTYVIIGVVAACSVILVILAYYLRREFGMQRYRFLGADLQIRKYYFHFQVFECTCYFSAFFCAGFGIQFIWLILQKTDVEYIITWVAFPLSILLLVVGRFAAKYENKPSMACFFIGLVAGCGYFIFKLFRIWQDESTTYAMVSKSLTVFDALSLTSLLVCLASGIVVWLDFGKGLKHAVLSRPGASSLPSVKGFWGTGGTGTKPEENEMGLARRRISID